MTIINLLAAGTTQTQGAEQQQGNPLNLILMFAVFGIIFYLIALRPRRKEQKTREQMLGSLKKYDKVMTIGGIIGTVMEVREDEVIIKVDDSSNTRIKFTRGAIQRVLSSSETEKSSS